MQQTDVAIVTSLRHASSGLAGKTTSHWEGVSCVRLALAVVIHAITCMAPFVQFRLNCLELESKFGNEGPSIKGSTMEGRVLERLDSLRIELAKALGPMKPIFPLESSSELLAAVEKQERTTSQGLVRDAALKGHLTLFIRCDGEWIALPRDTLASRNVDWHRTVTAGKLFRFSLDPDYCDGADIFVESARWTSWKANKLKKRIDGYMPRPAGRKSFQAAMIDEAKRLLSDRPGLRLREAASLIEAILSERFPGQKTPKSRSIENVIRGVFKNI